MKRLLPILWILLITSTITIFWFSSKEDRERKSEKELIEKSGGPIDFNAHRFLQEKVDDFDNSITWTKTLYSENELPTDKSYFRMYDNPKISATLDITCTKYANNNRGYELTIDPPTRILNEGKRFFKVEIKWDDLQPTTHYTTPKTNKTTFTYLGNTISNSEDLIKKLDKHSKLQIRYQTQKGTQIAKFSLIKQDNYNSDISKLITKCSGAEY